MADGLSGVIKDVMGKVADLPKEIVSDAAGQLGIVDEGAKAMEQASSDSSGSSQQDNNKAQKDLKDKAREEQLRARLAAMIEEEIGHQHQNRLENEKQRDEEWEAHMQADEQKKQVEQKKAQDRVAAMIYQERAGSGEVGKRKG